MDLTHLEHGRPQVRVDGGLPSARLLTLPTIPAPVDRPGFRYRIDDISGVGIDRHLAGLFQHLQPGQTPENFHAIVGCESETLRPFSLSGAINQYQAKTSRSRISKTRAISINDNVLQATLPSV